MAENFLHFLANRAERRIQEAQKEGAFDHLPGEGRPLDLEDDSAVPQELRMAYKVLKNAGYLPPELADRKEINTILDLLEHCEDGAEKLRQMQKLDVILMRMKSRRSRSVAITENDPYYEKVVRRITLIRNGRR
ncbi:DnaJ family domain-containing protein [Mailhella massiliensis]|uniref:DnaJ family domain-containing protein n=1 Tax=Mailhella massiliensis TaxID=1903261 RepID=UPI00097D792E|nr:DnaJ family domain-containing protein [Mailhella massiliensis]